MEKLFFFFSDLRRFPHNLQIFAHISESDIQDCFDLHFKGFILPTLVAIKLAKFKALKQQVLEVQFILPESNPWVRRDLHLTGFMKPLTLANF